MLLRTFSGSKQESVTVRNVDVEVMKRSVTLAASFIDSFLKPKQSGLNNVPNDDASKSRFVQDLKELNKHLYEGKRNNLEAIYLSQMLVFPAVVAEALIWLARSGMAADEEISPNAIRSFNSYIKNIFELAGLPETSGVRTEDAQLLTIANRQSGRQEFI